MKNTEKYYEMTAKLLSFMDDEDQEKAKKLISTEQRTREPVSAFEMIANIILDLRADLAEETAKAKGTGNLYKFAEWLIKDNDREALRYGKVLDDGYQYTCNGYIVLKVKEPLPVPECPTEIPYPHLNRTLWAIRDCDEVGTVDLAKVRLYNRICKAEKRNVSGTWKAPVLRIRDGNINSVWLEKALTVLPGAKLYITRYREVENFLLSTESGDKQIYICGMRYPAVVEYDDFMSVV